MDEIIKNQKLILVRHSSSEAALFKSLVDIKTEIKVVRSIIEKNHSERFTDAQLKQLNFPIKNVETFEEIEKKINESADFKTQMVGLNILYKVIILSAE